MVVFPGGAPVFSTPLFLPLHLLEPYVSFEFDNKLIYSKTGIECYYSESASIPIRIKVSARRLMYWWHIISVDKSELINRVYSAQKLSPVYGDWVKQLDIDKKQFDIKLSDTDMKSISQQKFKN